MSVTLYHKMEEAALSIFASNSLFYVFTYALISRRSIQGVSGSNHAEIPLFASVYDILELLEMISE